MEEQIKLIFEEIVALDSMQTENTISFDLLKEIVSRYNVDGVLTNPNFGDVMRCCWDIMDECSEEDYMKYHFAQIYVQKGICLINKDIWPSNTYEPIDYSKIEIPALTVEALKYKYANDKRSFEN